MESGPVKKSISKNNASKEKNINLTSIQELIQDAWELFQKTAVIYIKLLGVAIAFLLLGALIGVMIILPLSFTAFSSPHFNNFNQLAPFPSVLLVLLIIWSILYIVSFIVIGLVFPVVSIFVFDGEYNLSIFDLIKKSKKFLLPYFLTSLLSALLIFGGLFIFVVPGIVIAIFFAFVGYEVVLEGQSGRAALKRSYFLVKCNFWEVILRAVTLQIGLVIISTVLTQLAGSNWLLNLVKFLFSIFSVWYSRAYFYLLYKQLRAKSTLPSNISIQWIWIVSGIGWALVLIVAGVFTGSGLQMPHMTHPRHLSPLKYSPPPGAV